MSILLLLGASLLICLLPLAFYLIGMAHINGRNRPTLLSGPLDFTYLVFGIGGFLVVGGPILVSFFDTSLRSLWIGSTFQQMRVAMVDEFWLWSGICLGYIAFLLLLFLRAYRLRGGSSVVYNCKGAELERMMKEIDAPAGYALEPLPAMHSVTIQWNAPAPSIAMNEEKLAARLAETPVAPNTLAGWLQNAAVGLLVVMFMWIALIFLFYFQVI